MVRKFLIILLALCAVVAAQGKPTMAVYPEKKGGLGAEAMEVLCAKILNALEVTGYFQGIERSAEFLAAINEEISNQVKNNSDDKDIAKFSDRFKADFVCAVVIRSLRVENQLEHQVDARIINVKTSHRVFTGETTGKIVGMDDLQRLADKVVEKMFKGITAQDIRQLSEMGVERMSEKGGASESGGGGQPAGTSAEKRSEPQVVRDEKFNIDMVFVQGGTFKMGCTAEQRNCNGDEKPVHNVTLGDFYIGKYPVTQKLWGQVMGSNPSKFKKNAKQSYTVLFAEEDNFPVENVSYMMVQEFIEKLNAKTGKRYRLPTEAEWEYAARGGNKSKGYIYSGGNYIDDVAWHSGNSQGKTHAVGGKEPNELGVYDMSGNVWEWANDWKGAYSSSDETNPKGPNKGGIDNDRVFRGGSWNYNAKNCRVSKREKASQDYKAPHGGFRLARSAQ